MQQLIICRGLPASGKSTFAKAWVLEDPKNRIRVNRDDIRRMLGPYWVPSRENLVSVIEKKCIFMALEQEYSVVVDATNFRPPVLPETADIYKCEWLVKDFTDVSVEECIERDSKRPKEEQVGAEVIINMAKKYLNHEKERNN